VTMPAGAGQAQSATVDEASDEGAPRVAAVTGQTIQLAPFAVTVIAWNKD
jgi:hypothetical protein